MSDTDSQEYIQALNNTQGIVVKRIAELEQQLAELREAVDEVLNASVSSLEYRSNRLQLAVWDLRAVRDKALLQESGDE